MTPEEHDSLYRLTNSMIADNYIKVNTLVQMLGTLYLDDPYARIGTVPERLAHLLGRLTGDPTMFADMVYPIETPNADDVACAEDPTQYRLVGTNIPMPTSFISTPKPTTPSISDEDLALVIRYGYQALPDGHPLKAYGSTSAVLSHEANEQMEKLRICAEYYSEYPPKHTPMAYDHTMIAPFVDLINEVGHIEHTPIGTVVEDSQPTGGQPNE